METARHITRTRMDIRKFKHTRTEKTLMKEAVDHCNKLKAEFEKDNAEKGYEYPIEPDFRVVDHELDAKRPPREMPAKIFIDDKPEDPQTPSNNWTTQTEPRTDEQTTTSKLSSELGPYWKCDDD